IPRQLLSLLPHHPYPYPDIPLILTNPQHYHHFLQTIPNPLIQITPNPLIHNQMTYDHYLQDTNLQKQLPSIYP
ncbi:hypothetical protein, partial [Priestia megaterium]|uniref:hypothetical protein n=1 Tax=Priestia megaterium TaxID=1404 RepID=UPI001C99F2F5